MKNWKYNGPGIPDQEFIRAEVPMTKVETRSVIMSKLQPGSEHIIYDIGAGTGSITVETALAADQGQVFALEKDSEAVELLKKNLDKFELNNVKVIPGEAAENIKDLKKADRIFIGGSGSRLTEILTLALERLKLKGILVMTAVTLDTLTEASQYFKEKSLEAEIISLAVNRLEKRGSYQMFAPLRPVFIIKIVKQER
ncbi:MAG: precorrin-6Y C5,15-methyltransferase (decarboxylating) subunit CbiT [Bacillota bacterium]